MKTTTTENDQKTTTENDPKTTSKNDQKNVVIHTAIKAGWRIYGDGIY